MLGYARMLNQSRGDLEEYPIRVGETVRLLVGGPRMTVDEIRADGWLKVVWTGKSGTVYRDEFKPGLVRRAGKGFFRLRR